MRLQPLISAILSGTVMIAALWAQSPFREYPGLEYERFPLPPDYQEKSEWVFARLMYPAIPGFFGRSNPNWQHGAANWTMDYPRSDRHLSQAVRRLTRVHARSVEQPVNLDAGDEVFDWPWLYGVEVGYWALTEAQISKMREYLLRGGFFMCDDFHGVREWDTFTDGIRRIFPDRPIVEIENGDAIFHVLYNLDSRYQVPGAQYIRSGVPYENGGMVPHWRGIYDDKGRIMVAMCFNMDLGDSWEHADNPEYPEKFSALGLRIGVNYIIYSMTH